MRRLRPEDADLLRTAHQQVQRTQQALQAAHQTYVAAVGALEFLRTEWTARYALQPGELMNLETGAIEGREVETV